MEHEKITLPDYACAPSFRVIREPDEWCDGNWEKTETDDMIYWHCTKCNGKASCEVYD